LREFFKYSRKVDTTLLSNLYRGGDHPEASGFSLTKKKEFEALTDVQIFKVEKLFFF